MASCTRLRTLTAGTRFSPSATATSTSAMLCARPSFSTRRTCRARHTLPEPPRKIAWPAAVAWNIVRQEPSNSARSFAPRTARWFIRNRNYRTRPNGVLTNGRRITATRTASTATTPVPRLARRLVPPTSRCKGISRWRRRAGIRKHWH